MSAQHGLAALLGCTSMFAGCACGAPAMLGDASVVDASSDASTMGIDADSTENPCDGSDAIRAAYFVAPQGIGSAEYDLLTENGHAYLYVNGRCEAWAIDVGDPRGYEARRLALDPVVDGPRLGAELFLGALAEHDDVVLTAPGVSAHDTEVVTDGEHAIQCRACLAADDHPSPYVAAFRSARTWIARVRGEGEPVAGAVRVRVLSSSGVPRPPDPVPPAWPLATPIDPLVSDRGELGYGLGIALVGADAEALRAMRNDWLLATHWRPGFGYCVPVVAGASEWDACVVDALPFADERGLVRLGE